MASVFDKFIQENLDNIQNNAITTIPFRLTSNITETDFDDQSRTAVLTVIKKGWSANGFYYTMPALEDIRNHIEATASQVYLNHNPREKAFEPRLVQDHVADSIEVWVENETVKSRAKFLKSGPNAFVFDRMKESKKSLGPSIVGRAEVKKGEIEGVKGNIVLHVTFLHSYDMVAKPAAGGAVEEVFETITLDDAGNLPVAAPVTDTEVDEGLKETIARGKQRREARDKFYELESAFYNTLSNLVFAEGEFIHIPVKERRGMVSGLVEELTSEITKISFLDPIPMPKTTKSESEDTEEGVSEGFTVSTSSDGTVINAKHGKTGKSKFMKNSFTRVSLSKLRGIEAVHGKLKKKAGNKSAGIYSYRFSVSNGWTETKVKNWLGKNVEEKESNTKEGVQMADFKNLAEMKVQEPILYQAILTEANESNAAAEDFNKFKADSQELTGTKTDLSTAEGKVTTLTDENKTLTESNKTLTEANKTFKANEASVQSLKIITECKKTAEISEDHCSKEFNADLETIAYESEEQFRTAVTSRLAIHKALITQLSKNAPGGKIIEGVGNSPEPNKDVSEGENKYPMKSEDVAKKLKIA